MARNHGNILSAGKWLFSNWARNLPVAGPSERKPYDIPHFIPISGSAARVMNAVWTALEIDMLRYANNETGRIGRWFFRKDVARKIAEIQRETEDQL